jgi:hypothetical protein
MSPNNYKLHLLVLPEDDANRQIANGFITAIDSNAIGILPIAGGWKKAVEQLVNDHAPRMRQFPARMIVVLIDFDDNQDRLSYVQQKIPEDLQDRMFVLGVRSEPENLRSDTKKSFESIGENLAQDCTENTNEFWGHALLEHNKSELDRMIALVKPFLFT